MTVNQLNRLHHQKNVRTAALALQKKFNATPEQVYFGILVGYAVEERKSHCFNQKDIPTIKEVEESLVQHSADTRKYINKRTPSSVQANHAIIQNVLAENSSESLRRQRDDWRRRFNNTPRLRGGRTTFDTYLNRRRTGDVLFAAVGDDQMRVVPVVAQQKLVNTHTGGETVGTFNIRTIHQPNTLALAS